MRCVALTPSALLVERQNIASHLGTLKLLLKFNFLSFVVFREQAKSQVPDPVSLCKEKTVWVRCTWVDVLISKIQNNGTVALISVYVTTVFFRCCS